MAALARIPVGFWACLLAAALLLAGPAPLTCAEEDEGAAEEAQAEESPLRDADADAAKKLLDDLKKVAKKKNANDVLPKLEALEEVHHECFEKTLIKLLKHPSSLVAVKTAEMWEWRVTPKNLKKVWKASWGEKANKRRFVVKTKVLRALARARHVLDKRQYDEVEREWRWMIGNPNESYADALIDICWYFEKTKDKRHCRWMAEELDEPMATNVNSGSNPPADWWERRWKMWKPMKPAVVSALMAITGKEFDKTAEAKAWFEANEKTFGFEW